MDDIKNITDSDITLMLVGNKLDRVEHDPSLRRVRKEDAKNFAKDFDLLYLETSAISGQNVANCFEDLLQSNIIELTFYIKSALYFIN